MLEDNNSSSESAGIIRMTDNFGLWTDKRYAFSQPLEYLRVRELNYSSNSGYAVIVGMIDAYNASFMIVRPDDEFSGLNRYYVIDKETDQIIDVKYDEIIHAYESSIDAQNQGILSGELFPYYIINKAEMSPDGRYMLILAQSGDEARLFMANLDTHDSREVTGIDPAAIQLYPLTDYRPIIEWNTDTLIIGTKDGIRLYSFK